MLIQGILKGADTFHSFMIKTLDNLRKFFHITKVSIKCHLFDNFAKTVNLNFNGLTGVNSLYSISRHEMTKKGSSELNVRSLRVVDYRRLSIDYQLTIN